MELEITGKRKNILEGKGLITYEDVMTKFLPRKYRDYRTEYREIEPSMDGCTGCFIGKLESKKKTVSGGRSTITARVRMADGKMLRATYFGQAFMDKELDKMLLDNVAVFGTLKYDPEYGFSVMNPEYTYSEKMNGNAYKRKQRLLPIYPKYSGVSEEAMLDFVKEALGTKYHYSLEEMGKRREEEYLGFSPMDTRSAYSQIHNPQTEALLKEAEKRVIINKLWDYSLRLERSQNELPKDTKIRLTAVDEINRFVGKLPYPLTLDQHKYAMDMLEDMKKGTRINALLQGDVGCGKTLVAFIFMMAIAFSGYQAVLAAPTTILAKQHYDELSEYLKDTGIKLSFYGGKMKTSEKNAVKKGLANGSIQIVVGTQALCNDVEFKNLGAIAIDEEHRFGVLQKEAISKKAAGSGAHCLYMSATPIPRTMASALYGNAMKVYDIHTMPKGRSPIQTAIAQNDETVMNFAEKILRKGQQVYVVCPMIEESEAEAMSEVRSAVEVYEAYVQHFLPLGYRVGILTGRMTEDETKDVIESFRKGEIHILVSTTVIEVGVSVPNASLISIVNAERFGLATLHQLRGRVGRGQNQGYCILQSKDRTNPRLNTMVASSDGFEISEKDMTLRGTGDLTGIEQSGYNETLLLILQNAELYRYIAQAARDEVAGKKN